MGDISSEPIARLFEPSACPVAQAPPIPDHQLLRCIGQGAYGQVWLAKNVLGTFRAVKIVYRQNFADPRPYEREFSGIKHFEPISRLHPGLVHLLHVGRNDSAGCFYYVMELADDRSLGQNIDPACYAARTLRSEVSARGRLPAQECVSLGLSLISGLGYLHEHGLIHRDIKPANVIFVSGTPKLADIGLVTHIREDATSVGTEGYLPPEGRSGASADLYSLGKVLYELSTGLDRTQFPSLPTRLHQFTDAAVVVRLNQVILKACDASARKRFQSAAQLEAALRAIGHQPASKSPQQSLHSVAVLPFVNMSPDRENEYLSDGITDDLTTALAQVKGLRVAGRTSAFAFKRKHVDARQIAQELGVRAIVEGSVRKSGQHLRISAQLIDAEDGCCLWSERYDRQMEDVFALQDEISRAIVSALKVKLAPDEQGELVKAPTASTQAYQLYLQGRFYWSLRGEHLRKAMHYFELALLEDPQYALAYSGLADCWNLLGFYAYMPPKETFPQGKAAALQAVQLDPGLAEAHNSLGFSDLMYDWDWRSAVREFVRALEINPAYSPARYWLASFYSAAGRHAEAIAEDLRGIDFDPLSAIMRTHLGWTYLHARQYDRALEQLRQALAIDPQFLVAHWGIGRVYEMMGSYAEAREEFQKLLAAPPLDSWGIAWLGHTAACMGDFQGAGEALGQLERISKQRYVRPYWFAALYLAMGKKEPCLEWLQKCIDERDVWIGWVKCDPTFDSLQSDPRLARIWNELGLDHTTQS